MLPLSWGSRMAVGYPKAARQKKGPLPAKYKLKEMRTTSYPKRTEKNILDSDGTVIFTFGKLTWGSELTRKLAKTHGFPCLHVDLNKVSVGEGAKLIRPWIEKHSIKVLNVAGSRASLLFDFTDYNRGIIG